MKRTLWAKSVVSVWLWTRSLTYTGKYRVWFSEFH